MDWIFQADAAFGPLVLPNAPLLTLGEGYAWLEGPVWFADQDCLLVSDLPNDRILRWTESRGVSVFRQPSISQQPIERRGKRLRLEQSFDKTAVFDNRQITVGLNPRPVIAGDQEVFDTPVFVDGPG